MVISRDLTGEKEKDFQRIGLLAETRNRDDLEIGSYDSPDC